MSELNQEIVGRESGLPENPERATSVGTIAVGAVLGAVIGYFAVVALVGAVVGLLVGAAAGGGAVVLVRRRWRRERERNAVLDREIGVIGGDIGVG